MFLKTFLTISLIKFALAEETFLGQARIVNGDPIDIEAAPYYCSISKPPAYRHFCGGAIISTKWILSAAHCVDDDLVVTNYRVRTGSSRISRGGILSNVTKIIVHPSWDPKLTSFDFALLQLKTSLRLNDRTKVIKLPTEGFELTEGTEVMTCGHGATANPLHSQELFRGLILRVTNYEKCKAAWGLTVDTIICVTSPTKEQSVCAGDSGGPLEETKNGTLVGIASFAATPSASRDPKEMCYETGATQAGFAKVSAARAWIKSMTKI